jgi:hypothetical protein
MIMFAEDSTFYNLTTCLLICSIYPTDATPIDCHNTLVKQNSCCLLLNVNYRARLQDQTLIYSNIECVLSHKLLILHTSYNSCITCITCISSNFYNYMNLSFSPISNAAQISGRTYSCQKSEQVARSNCTLKKELWFDALAVPFSVPSADRYKYLNISNVVYKQNL